MSKNEVSIVNDKYANEKKFGGVKLFDGGELPFDEEEFDFVTCIECIEHMLPEHIGGVLDELNRVMKKDGVILVTTPNNEKLEESGIYCPNCDTVFHPHGHIRSFNSTELKEIMEKHGFKTIICDGTDFSYIQRYLRCPKIIDLSIRQCRYRLSYWFDKIRSNRGKINSPLFKRYMRLNRKPHLFYVGIKTRG